MANQMRELLTATERAACWRLGAYAKFAAAGIRPSQIDAVIAKKAGVADVVSPTNMAKTVATVSLLTGVPLGVAAHVVGNRISKARGKEKELQQQAEYYRNAAAQLEQGLGAGAKVAAQKQAQLAAMVGGVGIALLLNKLIKGKKFMSTAAKATAAAKPSALSGLQAAVMRSGLPSGKSDMMKLMLGKQPVTRGGAVAATAKAPTQLMPRSQPLPTPKTTALFN